jgi:hypothetical protein
MFHCILFILIHKNDNVIDDSFHDWKVVTRFRTTDGVQICNWI